MDRLKELLIAIKAIVAEDHAKRIEQTKHGENFNVFKVLNMQRDEVHLHSAFIAELLNPNGSHGMKDTFLKLFKEVCIDDDGHFYRDKEWGFDTKTTSIYVEHPIKNGRIDILIECNGKALIIENKIDACDQNEQLTRYDKYAEQQYGKDNYQIIYLTLNGKEASEKSTGKDPELSYTMVSYKEDIRNWLNKCIEKSARLPFVRETLIQYLNNLNDILGMMNEESIIKLAEVATSDNYINATLAIIKNQEEIRAQIIRIFISRMEDIAKEYGLECCTCGDLPNLGADSGLFFYHRGKTWGLYIGTLWGKKNNSNNGIWYGITQRDVCKKKRLTKKKLKEIPTIWKYQDVDYPLGRSSFYGERETRKWYNWKNWSVMEEMVNGELAEWIENHIFKKLKNNDLNKNLLKYIENITKED